MTKKVKLEDSEIESLIENEKDLNEFYINLGQLRTNFKVQEETLLKNIKELRKYREKLLEKMDKKYGEGTVDLSSGIFTPTQEN